MGWTVFWFGLFKKWPHEWGRKWLQTRANNAYTKGIADVIETIDKRLVKEKEQ